MRVKRAWESLRGAAGGGNATRVSHLRHGGGASMGTTPASMGVMGDGELVGRLGRKSGGGVGWELMVVELMVAEYGVSLYEAVWVVPMRVMVRLLPARRERMGQVQVGLSEEEECGWEMREVVGVWLEENFEVVDGGGLKQKKGDV